LIEDEMVDDNPTRMVGLERTAPVGLPPLGSGSVPESSEAYEHPSGGPPMELDDPYTVGNGNWEINTAVTWSHAQGVPQVASPVLDINYGVGERGQLNGEIPVVVTQVEASKAHSGLGNVSVALRYRFVDQSDQWPLAASVYPRVEVNVSPQAAARGIVEKGASFLLPIQVARVAGRFSYGGSAGVRFQTHGPGTWFMGVIGGHNVSHTVQALAEGIVEKTLGERTNTVVVDLGTRIVLTTAFNLLLSVGTTIDTPGNAVGYRGYLGVQFHKEGHQ